MDQRVETLKVTLQRLAAQPAAQAEYLDKLLGPNAEGYGNDELALELDDAFGSHEALAQSGSLTDQQAASIQVVSRLLGSCSGPAERDFWKRAALTSDPRWDDVRMAAAAALRTFG